MKVSSNSANALILQLFVAATFLNTAANAAYWRYIVGLQGQSRDASACAPPTPSVSIQAGTAPITIVTTELTSCSVPASGVGIVCTGAGTVTFDVTQPAGTSQTTLVNIEMKPPTTSFTCSSGLPVAQAYTLGQLCPDGTGNFMQVLNCSPAQTFRFTGLGPRELGSVICVTDCSGPVCTEDDFLPSVSTSAIARGCVWESTPGNVPTAVPNRPPVPAPTRSPTASPPNTCAAFGASCQVGADCCSDRCVFNKCQKPITDDKNSLAGGRGGAAGVAKATGGGRRKLFRSVRGSAS